MSAAEALASPSKSVEAGAEGAAADAELPKALVKRIVKAGLAQWDAAAGGDGKRDFQVNKVRSAPPDKGGLRATEQPPSRHHHTCGPAMHAAALARLRPSSLS